MADVVDARRKTIIGCVLLIVAVIAMMFVYIYPVRSYYEQRRVEQVEKHRLSVLRKANAQLKEQQKALLTDPEIERIAREQYHLVKPGEEAYIVSGQEQTTTTVP